MISMDVCPCGRCPWSQECPAARFFVDWLDHPTNDEYWQNAALHGKQGEFWSRPSMLAAGSTFFLGSTLNSFIGAARDGGSELARHGRRLLIGPWGHGSVYAVPSPTTISRASPPRTTWTWMTSSLGTFSTICRTIRARIQTESAHLRHGRKSLAQRGRLATPAHPIYTMVPAQRRRCSSAGGQLSPSTRPRSRRIPTSTIRPTPLQPWVGRHRSRVCCSRRAPGRVISDGSRRAQTCWSTRRLRSNTPLEQPGPLSLILYAATTAPDTDFVAKLTDVTPDGESRILAEGILRASYREGFDRRCQVEEGRVYEYKINLVATSYVFARPSHPN